MLLFFTRIVCFCCIFASSYYFFVKKNIFLYFNACCSKKCVFMVFLFQFSELNLVIVRTFGTDEGWRGLLGKKCENKKYTQNGLIIMEYTNNNKPIYISIFIYVCLKLNLGKCTKKLTGFLDVADCCCCLVKI